MLEFTPDLDRMDELNQIKTIKIYWLNLVNWEDTAYIYEMSKVRLLSQNLKKLWLGLNPEGIYVYDKFIRKLFCLKRKT